MQNYYHRNQLCHLFIKFPLFATKIWFYCKFGKATDYESVAVKSIVSKIVTPWFCIVVAPLLPILS